MFVKVFSDSSVSCATVFRWHSRGCVPQYFDGIAGFVSSEQSTDDTEQNGGLETTKMDENIAPVAAVLKYNRRASYRMIAESTGIPKTIIHHILPDDLKK